MIPKIIHYCWLSGDPYPSLVECCIKSWRKKLKGYEFILWDKNKIDINSNIWLKEAYENKKYAFAADYIRCFALFHYGGIYLDSDVEVIKPFDDFLNLNSFIGYDSTNAIEAAIIGSEKHSNWIKNALDYYENRHFVGMDGRLDTRPIPRMFHFQLHRVFSFIDDPNVILVLPEISLFPSDYFSPKNYQTKKLKLTDNTYTIHHFDGNWLDYSGFDFLKKTIHRLLFVAFGSEIHAYVVCVIRNIKSRFRKI